jgi:hypothetical protein
VGSDWSGNGCFILLDGFSSFFTLILFGKETIYLFPTPPLMPFKGAIAQKSLKIKMSQIASLSTFLDAEFRADSEKRNYKV